MPNYLTIGTYLNPKSDRLITAEVHISGEWTIRGGTHLFAPTYHRGKEGSALDAVKTAIEFLEGEHERDAIRGDGPSAIRWYIDITAYGVA